MFGMENLTDLTASDVAYVSDSVFWLRSADPGWFTEIPLSRSDLGMTSLLTSHDGILVGVSLLWALDSSSMVTVNFSYQ